MLLAVDALTLHAGGRTIVDGVSFDAREGEIVAVIGPNGAGKTTLLEAIVGVRPGGDRVSVRGRRLRAFGDRADAFAFAPDDAVPPPEATVATLIEHAHARRPRSAAILDELRRGLRIESLRARSAGVLSRGERKRVALYLALAVDRPVVVLDEPFGAFDPLQLRDVFAVVRSIAETGSALVVSVHQLIDAERIADRVLLLADGRRIAFGAVDEVRGGHASLEDAFVSLLGERRAS